MYVRAHALFEGFMAGLAAQPQASLVHSLSEPPVLADFLAELDPLLPLDWSGQSFFGLPALREQVLGRTRLAAACSTDDVLITAGAAEANFLAISQLVQPGDEMIVDVPGWPQPLVLGEAIGAVVKHLQRHETQGWKFDLDQLAELVNERTRLIFLCNPNNPTGQVVSDAELRRVVDIAQRVGAYVLCDEVYAGLEWDGQAIPRVAGYYDRGISTGSVSKALGLQGLRTGWMICRDPQLLFDAMVLREDTSEIMNIMGEAIAEIALREERYAAAMACARAAGRRNLATLDAWIDARAELSWVRPAAGLIGFCRLDTAITADTLAAKLLAEPYRTFVMPGSAYGFSQHLRLGVGGGADSGMELALQRLGACLDALSR
ncbi:MAG: aminotransferase class I/II-fold pyridoxal phosphate-dependent enzyme [Halioglobus sp.]|nr:aminotransferase class I/II-fold pyridoxal phosphate-dependent enzyme [Halioglobus sp.]